MIYVACFLKAAVNTILPQSPFFAFCTPESRPLQAYNKMRLDVCVNEMALFGPHAVVVKGETFFDSDGLKCGLPTRRDDGSTRCVLPIDRHGFAEGFEYFRTLCGVQSSLVRFAPNRAIAWGPPQSQAP